MASTLLTKREELGLIKVGNILLPGDDETPNFLSSGALQKLDDVIGEAHPQDLKELKGLLGLLGRLPRPFVRFLIWLFSLGPRVPGPLGRSLRLGLFGLKGIVMTLYYSQNPVREAIGWKSRLGSEA